MDASRLQPLRTDSPQRTSFITQVTKKDTSPSTPSRLSANGMSVKSPALGLSGCLLYPHQLSSRQLLVLDLDETLLHASVEMVPHDVSFVVDMESTKVPVFIKFRPHLMQFLKEVSRAFEVVIFTASLSRYANQVLDYIDPSGELFHHRLFREHCSQVDGSFVKDLSLLGRPVERVTIIDNSPVAYLFHPENAIPILSWFDDAHDKELLKLIPWMKKLSSSQHVYSVLDVCRAQL